MSSDSTNVHGSCNCGLITLSIPSTSFATFASLCHCLNCRASSGFAVNLPTPLADIKINGTTKVYNDTGNSGNTVYRHFCGNCGSPIMSVVATRPDTAFVKGGLFKKYGFDLPAPARQAFTRRCEKWETLMPDVEVIE